MLRPRIIPCLLIKDGGLVKTIEFDQPKYVGDPVNAVRIFNEKEVDELMVIDIDATVKQRGPRFELIRQLAAECRMPLCYGGGVTTVDQFETLVGLGVEKVAIASAAIENPQLIADAARAVGGQSVAVVMDVKADARGYSVWTHNGKQRTDYDPVSLASKVADLGAGELIVNSIDRDGRMNGYDLDLAARVRAATGTPTTFLGGAGSLADIKKLLEALGTVGAAAGSLFVFKGVYRAVLINYPNRNQKDALLPA